MAWRASMNWLFSFFCFSLFMQLLFCSSIYGMCCFLDFVLYSLILFISSSFYVLSSSCVLLPSTHFLPSVHFPSPHTLSCEMCRSCALLPYPYEPSLYLGFSPIIASKNCLSNIYIIIFKSGSHRTRASDRKWVQYTNLLRL